MTRVDRVSEPMYFGSDTDDALDFLTAQFATALAAMPHDLRARAALERAVTEHATADGVRLGSAAWLTEARVGSRHRR